MAKLLLILLISISSIAWTFEGGWDPGQIPADRIGVNTDNFDNNLSSTDSDVQTALETLDELTTGGGSESDPLAIHLDGTSTTTAQIPFAKGILASETQTDPGTYFPITAEITYNPSSYVPTQRLGGILSSLTIDPTSTYGISNVYGMQFLSYNQGSGTINNMFGLYGEAYNAGGTINQLIGVYGTAISSGANSPLMVGIDAGLSIGSASTVTDAYGMFIDATSITGGSTVDNLYGLYIDDQAGAGTLNYALYTKAGAIRLGALAGSGSGVVAVDNDGVLSWSAGGLSVSVNVDQTGGTSDTYGVLAGSVNGANTTFTVSATEYVSGSLQVYLNGQLQTQGSSEDWVETTPASGTFDFITAPATGDEITAVYKVSAGASGDADTLDGNEGSAYLLKSEMGNFSFNGSSVEHDATVAADAVIENKDQDKDVLVKINDGGTAKTAIQVHGAEGSVSMPLQSYVKAYLSADQTIGTASYTKIDFDTEVVDSLGEFDTSTQTFTAKYAGVYAIQAMVRYTSAFDNSELVIVDIRVGGSQKIAKSWYASAGTVQQTPQIEAIGFIKLAVGDTMNFYIYQNSGGNKNIRGTAESYSHLIITKVS